MLVVFFCKCQLLSTVSTDDILSDDDDDNDDIVCTRNSFYLVLQNGNLHRAYTSQWFYIYFIYTVSPKTCDYVFDDKLN